MGRQREMTGWKALVAATLALVGLLLFGLGFLLDEDESANAGTPAEHQIGSSRAGSDGDAEGSETATGLGDGSRPQVDEKFPREAKPGSRDAGGADASVAPVEDGTATIEVQVGCDGRPVSEVTVTASSKNTTDRETWLASRVTRHVRGSTVTLEGLAAEGQVLEVHSPDCAPAKVEVPALEAGEDRWVEIDLEKGWVFRGRLVSDQRYCEEDPGVDPTPPKKPVVHLSATERPFLQARPTVSDRGVFEQLLVTGSYNLGVWEKGGAELVRRIAISRDLDLCLVVAGDEEDWMELGRKMAALCDHGGAPSDATAATCGEEMVPGTCSITGTVIGPDGPMAGAVIQARHIFPADCSGEPLSRLLRLSAVGTTDTRGGFVLSEAPCLTTGISVRHRVGRRGWCAHRWVELDEGDNPARVDLVLQEAR